jgi:hypothetical protein
MVARQHPAHDMDAHLVAGPADDLAQTLAHRPLHDLLSLNFEALPPKAGFKIQGEKIQRRSAEADRLQAGGFDPLGGK